MKDHNGVGVDRDLRIENLDKFKLIFWDADVSRIDTDQYKFYIIERILEYGNQEHVAWMVEHYSREEIIDALNQSRSLSPKSFQFWQWALETA